MRILIWIVRLAIFLVLFGFAVKNDQIVSLKSYLGGQWHLPLVFVILIAFAAGAVVGVSATVSSLLRQRREIARLRRSLRKAEQAVGKMSESTEVVPAAEDGARA
ncbi:LapA family protein [Nitrogeniibacter mangrovi]|uniref:LapA family protein n=1 Tax=Nitrogeniibacter mangrovi TaxID=2016596 RepID=A0A6C1B1Z8_9RHOO|nr:LapA family protein [Nitrogeniibacter mangrovi]QID17393.1 LapA family protein [Nitrogeniibacter mangrovi]